MRAAERQRFRDRAIGRLYAGAHRDVRLMPTPTPKARALPPGYQYTGGCGRQARRRYLRQRLALCLEMAAAKDDHGRPAYPGAAEARDRLMAAVCDEPYVLGQLAHLAHVALQAAEDTGQPWADSVNVMLDKFEGQSAAAAS